MAELSVVHEVRGNAPAGAPVGAWTSFVAVGDSFTEGLEDLGEDGTYRGWADLLAQELAQHQPGLRYANLAVRGRLMSQIAVEQVPRALAMQPDLVSLVGGVNDILRPSFDLSALRRRLEWAVAQLRDAGCDVVMVIGVNPTARSRALTRLMPRITALNDATADVAERYDCYTVDLFEASTLDDARFWATDRLHLSSLGHERVAGAFLEALGLGDESWLEPLPTPHAVDWWTARRGDAAWVRDHLLPWVGRRTRGESAGEGALAKRPLLTPVVEH